MTKTNGRLNRGSIGSTPRRVSIFGMIAFVLVLPSIVFRLADPGPSWPWSPRIHVEKGVQ
jgi:hypothetical protein